MHPQMLQRIQQLVVDGQNYARESRDDDYWVADVSSAQAWMASAANAVQQLAPVGSFYLAELDRLSKHADLANGIPRTVLQKMHGVLRSVTTEAETGLLDKIENQIFASAFDDFLDHATDYHKSGKVKEAAVLAAAVLEDALKRLASKHEIQAAGVSLDPLIDELVKAGVFTSVKAKRMKSFAGVRNSALHAEWDKLELRDVGATIDGVRELLDVYL